MDLFRRFLTFKKLANRVSHKHLSISSDLGQLKTVRDAVLELAEPCLPKQAHMVMLAVDEAVSNVMRHSGPGGGPMQCSDADAIDVDIDSDENRLQVQIADRGPEFNPCSAKTDEPADRVRSRLRGGMGVSIIRKIMDEVHYDRTPDQRNQLTLVKFIDRPK